MSLKVAVCGPGVVGKSTLIKALSELPTRSASLSSANLQFCKVTEYPESFESEYQLIIVMCDLTDEDSFDETLEIAKLVKKRPKLLIGNKSDLSFQRAVDHYTAGKISKRFGMFYRELSCLNMKEVEDLKEIIEDIVLARIQHHGKWKFHISNTQYSKLKTYCKWLSLTTMLQGLGMMSFGSLLFLCLPDYQSWLGDFLMYVGTLTFLIAFLGFYGITMQFTNNEYSLIVRT